MKAIEHPPLTKSQLRLTLIGDYEVSTVNLVLRRSEHIMVAFRDSIWSNVKNYETALRTTNDIFVVAESDTEKEALQHHQELVDLVLKGTPLIVFRALHDKLEEKRRP